MKPEALKNAGFADIKVIDFVSRFGLETAKTDAAECLRRICEDEIFECIDKLI